MIKVKNNYYCIQLISIEYRGKKLLTKIRYLRLSNWFVDQSWYEKVINNIEI